ncbi:MAG: 23S rRNA (pseudouridine(1915)-N(3))-methyltransferase RlmH [Rikenellaceae bacterium]|jgi:23S rRNA (pseudouridine1915-N3)-methyltransferase|nr:23S rRNA (pseudouridine(1915)-N(3))-methyltransferase RlmH [Rikenellaceae bacterium]
MRITLITVGKTVVPWVKQGLDEYIGRLNRYIPFSLVEIPELKGVKSFSEAQIKEREGIEILKAAGNCGMILLDEHGRELRSIEFADWLEKKLVHTGKDLCFVVGGAYGFSKEVYDAASAKLSLSKMTFNHQMVRMIFAEQLYRAFTIIKGEPYHHE